MNMMTRVHRIVLLLATLFIVCHLRGAAQEEKRDESNIYKPDSEKTLEERKKSEELKDSVLYGKPTRADNAARTLDYPTRREDLENRPRLPVAWTGPFPATTYVTFGPKEIRIETSGSRYNATVPRHDPDLRRWLDKGDVFVLKGEVTQGEEDLFNQIGQTVIVSKLSPKSENGEAALAATLLLRPLKAENAMVMNALPYETEGGRGEEELARMRLRGRPQEWGSARRQIVSAAGQMPIKAVTKKDVLKEFHEGNSNILFVIAHSDSNAIFLPGVAGGKITREDLDTIRRESTPNRAIVLLACKTGVANGDTHSIAEALIKNKLANVVVASDELISVKDVAEMLRNLQAGATLGQVFQALRAIVQVDNPPVRWKLTKTSEVALLVRDTNCAHVVM